jgi:hypothetical protein
MPSSVIWVLATGKSQVFLLVVGVTETARVVIRDIRCSVRPPSVTLAHKGRVAVTDRDGPLACQRVVQFTEVVTES